MKIKFWCAKHNVRLFGRPTWFANNYGEWLPDTSEMWCSSSGDCGNSWKVEDSMSISYKLLGIALEAAPNGKVQNKIVQVYNSQGTEKVLQERMLNVLHDGLVKGNWPE